MAFGLLLRDFVNKLHRDSVLFNISGRFGSRLFSEQKGVVGYCLLVKAVFCAGECVLTRRPLCCRQTQTVVSPLRVHEARVSKNDIVVAPWAGYSTPNKEQ